MFKRAALAFDRHCTRRVRSVRRSEAAAPAVELYAMDCGRATFPDVGMFADDGSLNGQSRDAGRAVLSDPPSERRSDLGHRLSRRDRRHARRTAWTFRDGRDMSSCHASCRATGAARSHAGGHRVCLVLTPARRSHRQRQSVRRLDLDRRCRRARLHVQRRSARRAKPSPATLSSRTPQTRLIEGDADYDVFGDGSVTIIQAPGHTPGHTVLLVRSAERRRSAAHRRHVSPGRNPRAPPRAALQHRPRADAGLAGQGRAHRRRNQRARHPSARAGRLQRAAAFPRSVELSATQRAERREYLADAA